MASVAADYLPILLFLAVALGLSFAFVVLFMANPGFYLDVADDPAFIPGFVGLLILYVVGFVTMRKMVDLKV